MTNNDEQPNRLLEETSPYLQQHAYNPVDWYPWGDEALAKAKKEDKPILVSIGYAACHWCHVMERESFESEDVAAIMNEHFVNIKVDREERPDIDQIYMDAVQAITGQGGWPLNMFLTPDALPFYGGTYFPPRPAHGRPSWVQVLQGVAQSYANDREKVVQQAKGLGEYILKMDGLHIAASSEEEVRFTRENADTVFKGLANDHDEINGGFGGAPKFPNTLSLIYLLRYYHATKDVQSLKIAIQSLQKMIKGGIYDQIGGGFARYSVDDKWLVPHFEKMLYDNALLIEAMCEAWQLTHQDIFKDAVRQTMSFLQREMTSTNGTFYASLDADSEGVEGKFYVWSKEEIEDILGDKADVFCHYYNVSDKGNWEGTNILHVTDGLEVIASEFNLSVEELKGLLITQAAKLIGARAGRVRPATDDKILTNWNAMMISACFKAHQFFGEEEYLEMGKQAIDHMLKAHFQKGELHHNYKEGRATIPAFLDDYALFIKSLLGAYDSTFDSAYLHKAKELTEAVFGEFNDPTTHLFYYTQKGQTDVIVRKREVYDSVTPSGNSTMYGNLRKLGILFDDERYITRAKKMLAAVQEPITKYGRSFSQWAYLSLDDIMGLKEIAVGGKDAMEVAIRLQGYYLPNKLIMAAMQHKQEKFPLLEGKAGDGDTLIYICESYACKAPIKKMDEFEAAIEYTYPVDLT